MPKASQHTKPEHLPIPFLRVIIDIIIVVLQLFLQYTIPQSITLSTKPPLTAARLAKTLNPKTLKP